MRRALLALLVLPMPAAAQGVFDAAPGLYGDATDPATACATNPHELSFLTSPPHMLLNWSSPATDSDGHTRGSERYDILGADDHSLTLRLEGDTRRTDDGGRPIWVMRMTQDGYCWGRTDWPMVRCEHPQVRCSQPVS